MSPLRVPALEGGGAPSPPQKGQTVFSRIVVGTDGSPDATHALKVAGQLATLSPAAAVHVVHAYEPLPGGEIRRLDRATAHEFSDQLTGDLMARAAVDEADSILRARGIDHTVHERRCDPADAIMDLVDEVKADLVVVGSRGEGAIDRLRHGSTSTKVLHEAPCSVLVVKSQDQS